MYCAAGKRGCGSSVTVMVTLVGAVQPGTQLMACTASRSWLTTSREVGVAESTHKSRTRSSPGFTQLATWSAVVVCTPPTPEPATDSCHPKFTTASASLPSVHLAAGPVKDTTA